MARSRPALLLPSLALNLLIASGTFLVAKRTLVEIPPLTLALFRFVIATAVLWPITRWLRPNVRISSRDRGRIVLLGVLGVPLNQGFFLFGLQWASASHAALLYALTPAFVVLIATRVGGAPPTLRQWIGIAAAFLGVLTLMLQRGLHVDRHSLTGDLIIIAAVMAWSGYLALGRDVTRRYGPLVVTAESLLAGTLVFLPIGLFALRGFDPGRVSVAGWGGLLYLAWLTSALNYVIWFWGLEYLKPGTVALMTNLQPVIAAAMAWVFLHESLPPGFALSTALVVGGVWVAQTAKPRGQGPPPKPLDAERPAA